MGAAAPDRGAQVGLALTAAGLMSAALETHFLREPGPNAAFVLGSGLGLAAAVLATRREPPAWSGFAALAASVGLFAFLTLSLDGALPGAVVIVALAALAYRLTDGELRPLAVGAFALWLVPALHFVAPTPEVGPLPRVVGATALAAGIVAFAALLDRSASDPTERRRRVTYAVLAVAGAAAVADRHLVVGSGGIAPDDAAAALLVLAVPLLSFAPLRAARRDAIAAGLGMTTLVFVGVALILGMGYRVDSVTVPHHAAELLLAGREPYGSFDLLAALARFDLGPEYGTHLESGEQLTSLNYPALSFLAVAPFIAAGLEDIRWVYLAELMLVAALLFVRARIAAPLAIAALLGNVVVLRQHVLAGIDPAWILLVAVAWMFFGRRTLSPIALGLAVASRQPAWFVAPFYVLAAWRREGRSAALRRAAIAALAAALPNLPFLVADPAAFAGGVLAPIVEPLQPYGVGLVRLGWSSDFVAPLPRAVYTLLGALAFPLALWWLWRRWPEWGPAARTFPLVPVWFAWRSLQNYFDAAPVFALPLGGPDEREAAEARDATRRV